jgi:hypothetical protein
MLYGSKYMEVVNAMKTGDGINGMKVENGVNGANGIQTVNITKLINDKKAMDALNGLAHT